MLKITLNKKIKKYIVVSILICMCALICSCGIGTTIKETKGVDDSLPQLNPDDGISYMASVDLYYRFCNTSYLIPKAADIRFSSNEREEVAILRAIISGTGINNIYTSTIPSGTELLNVVQSGNTLFITFNSMFIDDSQYATTAEKRMAVCEVLNTLSAYSNASIQILVDKSGNGIGERVTYQELGFDTKYDNNTDYAAPFGFTKSIMLTPATILDYAINCIQNKEYAKAAAIFYSNTKKRGITGEDISRFADIYEIKSYEIINTNMGAGVADVYCNIKFIENDTDKIIDFEGNIRLVAYQSYYKIQYESFTESAGGLK